MDRGPHLARVVQVVVLFEKGIVILLGHVSLRNSPYAIE